MGETSTDTHTHTHAPATLFNYKIITTGEHVKQNKAVDLHVRPLRRKQKARAT